jgi:hypothetical protein
MGNRLIKIPETEFLPYEAGLSSILVGNLVVRIKKLSRQPAILMITQGFKYRGSNNRKRK